MYVYVCACVCHMCGCLWKPEEGVRPPGARTTGSCELPDVMLVLELGSSGRAAPALSCQPSHEAPLTSKTVWQTRTRKVWCELGLRHTQASVFCAVFSDLRGNFVAVFWALCI